MAWPTRSAAGARARLRGRSAVDTTKNVLSRAPHHARTLHAAAALTCVNPLSRFSIYNMWNQDAAGTLPDGTPMNHTGFYPARPAAGALFGFSFVWPHLK